MLERSTRDLVTGGLGALLVAGVFTDGWAHFNRPGMETFFTPWHAALYSALGLMTAWLAAVTWRSGSGSAMRLPTSVPQGYGLALVGAALFALGGAMDLVWHELFGIEVALDALISPTHLVLGTGGLLILTTGMRSQGLLRSTPAPGQWTLSAMISLLLSLAVVVFFLLYTSSFPDPGPVEPFSPTPENTPGHREAELPVVAALASYLVTTVVMIVPVLVMARVSRPPRGALVLVVATVSLLPVAVVGLPSVATAGALGAVAGALVLEVLAPTLERRSGRASSWVLPGSMAALVWSGQLAGLSLTGGLGWPVSLWGGVVLLSALLAATLGFVAHASSWSGPSAAPEQRLQRRGSGTPAHP